MRSRLSRLKKLSATALSWQLPRRLMLVFKIVLPQECSPVHAGELRALVRVDQHLALRLPAPDGHEQGLQDHIGGLAALHRPADNTPRE